MIERNLYTLSVTKTATDMQGFLDTHPDFTCLSQEPVINEKLPTEWQKEIIFNAALIEKSESMYLAADERVLSAYHRLIQKIGDPMHDDVRQKMPPFEEAVPQIFDFLKSSHNAYSQLPARPFIQNRNMYKKNYRSDLLTPRQVRLLILGNMLTGEVCDKEALCEFEGIIGERRLTYSIQATQSDLFWHMRPFLQPYMKSNFEFQSPSS